ncbi:hypothetical protein FEM48_Zijuj05G0103400 [Ziziphus jujuba var. spinosa]|uniref:Uncharacterized protein n=1 Tax=Ziziphus jujuba var. spinosa TaxID=714518 RepID=A0A978VEE3_ZIZJJ|nr:hypothetical protein FEM48_Zijuj05G0103400 [Ziziphus jujuba var. spinosa]
MARFAELSLLMPTLALDEIREPKRHSNKPFWLSLKDHDEIGRNGTITIGRIETGILKPSMKITIAPTGLTAKVKFVGMNRCLIPNGYIAMLHCHTFHGSVRFEEIMSKSNLMSGTDDQDDQELKHIA